MGYIKLSVLIELTKTAMLKLDLAETTLKNCYEFGFKSIQQHFEHHNQELYSPQLTNQYVLMLRQQYEVGEIPYGRFMHIRKSASLLDEVYESDTIEWHYLEKWGTSNLYCDYFAHILTMYINEKQQNSTLSKGSIKTYKSIIHQFLQYLETTGHHDFLSVTSKAICGFLPHVSVRYSSSMKLVMASLRSFLVFLKDAQLIKIDILLITNIRPAMRRKVLPAYTREEASAILTSVDRETSLGKRDYAILLLAKKTGIRTIDIANLRFDNLDWQNNTINIIQHKTGHALSLPLAPDVGNAIAEYILNDRPDIQSNYIFLRHKAPYAKLCERGSLGYIARKYMKLGKVDNSERKGFHSFRRSIATYMLETETPMTTICQVLGQVKPDSIKPYLSLNDQKLRFCAL